MRCPHCHSAMHLVETATSEKSEVFFYRCPICVAEHVSCHLVTADRIHSLALQQSENYRQWSQHIGQPVV